MDVLLGRERTERSQIIKQADVLMLLFLLRDQYPVSCSKPTFGTTSRAPVMGAR